MVPTEPFCTILSQPKPWREEVKFQLFVDLAVMNACVSKLIYAAASHDQGMYPVLFPKCWKREICLAQATTPPTLEYHL